jgi:hypothetical protein
MTLFPQVRFIELGDSGKCRRGKVCVVSETRALEGRRTAEAGSSETRVTGENYFPEPGLADKARVVKARISKSL